MEIDHIIAAGIFILLFGFSLLFVSNQLVSNKEKIENDMLKHQADMLSDSILRNDTSFSLGTKVYHFYVVVGNPNSSSVSNEIVFLGADIAGYDPNSVAVYDGSNRLDFEFTGTKIAFLANTVPARSSKVFDVYIDDDSDFGSRWKQVNGTNQLQEKTYGPDVIDVIQYKKMIAFTTANYSQFSFGHNFHIKILNNSVVLFEYGLQVPEKRSVALVRRPILVQTEDAGIVGAVLETKVWQ